MQVNENAIIKLEEASKEVAQVRGMANSFKKSFALATGIQTIRNALTKEAMEVLMELQGNSLGFKTDKDRNRDGSKGPGYTMQVVRDVAIYAAMNDAYMCGNEVNIIAGNPYLTKEYYRRKINELIDRGFDINVEYGQYTVKGSTAMVPTVIIIKKEGQKDIKQQMNITVPCHAGFTGPDAILGKAEKRAKKWIYERLTGHMTQDGDVEDIKTVQSEVVDTQQTGNGSTSGYKYKTDIKPALDQNKKLFDLVVESGYHRPQLENLWSRHDGNLLKIEADLQDFVDNMKGGE